MNKVTWKRKNTKINSVAASVFCNENSEEEESDKEPSTPCQARLCGKWDVPHGG